MNQFSLSFISNQLWLFGSGVCKLKFIILLSFIYETMSNERSKLRIVIVWKHSALYSILTLPWSISIQCSALTTMYIQSALISHSGESWLFSGISHSGNCESRNSSKKPWPVKVNGRIAIYIREAKALCLLFSVLMPWLTPVLSK